MSMVSLDRQDPIAVITIDHPPVNALSQAVRAGVKRDIDVAAGDDSVQAIIIRCAGRTFIAGADIREFGKAPEAPLLPDLVRHIEALDKPVVAAVHGTALGGGLELAMGCHYRVAARSAQVGLPEVHLGLLPGAGGTQLLPRLAGAAAALEIMLSGKPVPATEALRLGIIDELAEDAALLDAARQFARRAVAREPRRSSELEVATVGPELFDKWRHITARKARGLISPQKIIDCVEAAATQTFAEGRRREREAFLECLESPQSGGLRHAFFAERAVLKVPGLDRDTEPRAMQKLAVLGAGTMGAGIAYSALTADFNVHLLDNEESALERGKTTIGKLFESGVERGKSTAAEAETRFAQLSTGTDFTDLKDADLVIEAVYESMPVKKDVFTRLGDVCKPGTILATNTSTLDIDAIAAASGRPADVIGLHFFSPAHVMRLLEIVRGEKTASDVIASSLALAKTLGKIGVVVGNCFGFVGNRMLYSYGRENQFLLLEGAAPEHIDQVLQDWGMAMGPNAVGDLAGLDVGYRIRRARTDLPDDPRFYRIADLLVEKGRLGQKTGSGIYHYPDGSRNPEPDAEIGKLIRDEAERLGITQRNIGKDEIIERCIFGLITEGTRVLEEGIAARPSDIDVIWINGYGFPRHRGGPMNYADSLGLDKVYDTVCRLQDRFGDQYWSPPELLKELARNKRSFADLNRTGGDT